MSGYTPFTSWIDSKAGYLIRDGQVKKIVKTFFTTNPIPNSDYFNITFEDDVTLCQEDDNWKRIDLDEALSRFQKFNTE